MPPSIKRFLEALPEIQLKDLSEDHKNCNICMEQYTDATDAEKPVSLRCGHIFGSSCIMNWVLSSEVSHHSTCPMCRATLTAPSDIERWENWAIVMQEQPYTSLSQTLHRRPSTSTSTSGDSDSSAVELVSLFFQVVMKMQTHHRDHPSALLRQSAQALAGRMGRLYVLLKPTMDAMGVTVPWDERGPPVVALLDLECERGFLAVFGRLMEVERRAASESGG